MNSVKNEERIEPYILLFPTGCLLGLLGLVFWIFFQLGWIQFYPRALHGNLMFFGFLWSFVAGFLMTAVPKMTSTSAAHIGEISFAVALVFIQMVLNVRNLTDISVFVFLMQNAFLLFFVVRRFLVNRKVPFFGFIFLPMAFIQSVLGVALYFFYSDRSLFVLLSGEAFILNLILGLGSRLIPVISRLPNALLPNESSSSDSLTWPLVTLLLLNVGYWCEVFNFREFGVILRIFGILIAAVKLLRLFVVPVTWSYVGVGLKISVVMLAIGQIFSLSFFNSVLAGQHIIYIGGFSTITLLIATRVILAHGNQSLNYEISSKRLISIVILLFISALIRFFVGTDVSNFFLSISALFFVFAIALWFARFFKILNSKINKEGPA